VRAAIITSEVCSLTRARRSVPCAANAPEIGLFRLSGAFAAHHVLPRPAWLRPPVTKIAS
jgi:hypothetical protein